MNGKGDTNRPKTVDYQTWKKNYESIFVKDKKIKKDEKKKR
mgnify:CR=1 FL=1|tara:strand:+ start:83 stop:205 length:123 start_codon:yes stop_codon:yes gene_type:complete